MPRNRTSRRTLTMTGTWDFGESRSRGEHNTTLWRHRVDLDGHFGSRSSNRRSGRMFGIRHGAREESRLSTKPRDDGQRNAMFTGAADIKGHCRLKTNGCGNGGADSNGKEAVGMFQSLAHFRWIGLQWSGGRNVAAGGGEDKKGDEAPQPTMTSMRAAGDWRHSVFYYFLFPVSFSFSF
jgi:hypothetical protein